MSDLRSFIYFICFLSFFVFLPIRFLFFCVCICAYELCIPNID